MQPLTIQATPFDINKEAVTFAFSKGVIKKDVLLNALQEDGLLIKMPESDMWLENLLSGCTVFLPKYFKVSLQIIPSNDAILSD